jgi:tricorn protease
LTAIPIWIGDTVYFNSDRDDHFNLYAYDIPSGKTAQLTTNKTYDVRWPSADRDGRIIYELNGELRIFDTRNKKDVALDITVPDEGLWRRPTRGSVATFIEDTALSPKGERVLFTARGDIFSAPVERGPTRNLTRSSNAHDKWARWSPDGATVAFISDKSGEEELYLVPQDGSRPAEQITTGGKAMRYAPAWSPDGLRIAFSDKDGKLYALTLADRRLTEITDTPRGQIRDYTWSPRGNHLAFSMADANGFSSIHIWSARDGKLRRVTDELFNEYSPAWEPKGEYLYYLSDREFAPQISSIEFNYALNRETNIYAMALRKDVKHPFPPESDEVTTAAASASPTPTPRPGGDGDPTKPKEPAEDINREIKPTGETAQATPTPTPTPAPSPTATPAAPADMTIDFDGLAARVARVPIEANNYGGLSVKAGHLLYGIGAPFYYGRSGGSTSLRIYSLKDRKETLLADDIRFYVMSDDGAKVLVAQGPAYSIYDATPAGDKSRKPVPTTGLVADRNPEEEWNQIFDEAWRRYRDWFYVENMHGYDWQKLREQYRPLLKYVAHRSDLNYVIGEMISELAVQHAYIEGGDFQLPARARVGLPGARFELDKAAGRFRISKIYEGQNEEEIYRSPLTGNRRKRLVGDYVLAIDGEELKGTDDPYRLLRNKADNPVFLTVNRTPSMQGSRTISYKPITDESNLIYLDWVNTNRRKVSEMTGGRVGYIHVPDMGAAGIREFIKWFYPQIRKEGMVVDVRANGGGNVSRMLIERLRRKVLALQYPRTSDEATTYPDAVMAGPMVALLNENSSSDGDIFPAMFREAGLGTLIGKRSWGGVVGITNRGTLIDGGGVSVPNSASRTRKASGSSKATALTPTSWLRMNRAS